MSQTSGNSTRALPKCNPQVEKVVEMPAAEPVKKRKMKKGLFAALAAEFEAEEANKEAEAARWGLVVPRPTNAHPWFAATSLQNLDTALLRPPI